MSALKAPRISAVSGYTYLSFAGRRLHVVAVSRDRVGYFDLDAPAVMLDAPRSIFDTCIESVIS